MRSYQSLSLGEKKQLEQQSKSPRIQIWKEVQQLVSHNFSQPNNSSFRHATQRVERSAARPAGLSAQSQIFGLTLDSITNVLNGATPSAQSTILDFTLDTYTNGSMLNM